MWAAQEMRRDFLGNISRSVRQVIEGEYGRHNRKIYLSSGRELGPYVIFTVLMIDAGVIDKHPRLHRRSRDRVPVQTSLIDAVANEFVSSCWELILRSFDGDQSVRFPSHDTILRAGANRFFTTVVVACDALGRPNAGYEAYNEIASLTYEKAVGCGRLIFAPQDHRNLHEAIAFKAPTPINNYRSVRKLLELAGGDDALICDAVNVVAMGRICGNYNVADESLFSVEFVGHSKWQLTHAGAVLMRVEYGIPQLPVKIRQVDQFVETFIRLFPATTDSQRKKMRRIAEFSGDLERGTIVVIRNDAAAEAARFKHQAFAIDPVELSDDILRQAARIDGAILVYLITA